MSTAARRRPDPADLAPPDALPRSSADCRAVLDAHDAERAHAIAEIARLEAGRDAVLLTGDDEAAERNEAEVSRLRRAVERAELRRPSLLPPIAEAERREAADRKAEAKVQAQAAIEAVLGRLQAGYAEPAAQIAAFLAEWRDANALAVAAGLECPEITLRSVPGHTIVAEDEVYSVWIDPNGVEQRHKPAPGTSVIDRKTGELVAENLNERNWLARWREESRTRPGRERYVEGRSLPSLATAVSLPPLRIGDPKIW